MTSETSENPDNKVVKIADRVQTKAESRDTTDSDRGSEADVCPNCFGTGTWLHPDKGPILCLCQRSNSKTKTERARVPQRFRESSLHNYYPKNNSQFFAHGFATKLIENYPGVDQGLLLMGGVGVGKTHLAVAILRELMEKKGLKCLFYESGSLLKAIQDSYNPVSQNSEMRVLAPVFQAEVLVLDELGATVPTNWVRDTLYQIINTRYNNKKLTIFTTNYFDETPAAGEDPAGSAPPRRNRSFASERIQELTTLEERIGTPLRSRLFEMCKKVMIEGEDYRKRLDQRRLDSPSA